MTRHRVPVTDSGELSLDFQWLRVLTRSRTPFDQILPTLVLNRWNMLSWPESNPLQLA